MNTVRHLPRKSAWDEAILPSAWRPPVKTRIIWTETSRLLTWLKVDLPPATWAHPSELGKMSVDAMTQRAD